MSTTERPDGVDHHPSPEGTTSSFFGTATSPIYKSPSGADAIWTRYREVLREWPVPAERRGVTTREGETFVLVSGPEHAPPLVLLHGSGGNSGTWRGDLPSWTTRFRVYCVDLVGEPGGSASARPDLRTESVARWLDDVLTGLGLTRTALVGMSLGGWTALDYAIRRPDRVTALALLCPGGVGRQRYGWLLKAIVPRLFGRRDLRRSAQLTTGLYGPELDPILDDIELTFTHFNPRTERLPRFTDEQLRGLSMPVLAIVGDRDAMLDSAETARRVTASVPDATVLVLPGVGHAVLGQTEPVLNFFTAHTDRT